VLQRIKKEQDRLHYFKYLTKHLGKGEKESLTRLHKKNENREIIKTHLNREEIKEKLIEYNEKYLKKSAQLKGL